MRILSLSDVVLETVYSPSIGDNYPDIDFVLACGDLPFYYVEYVVDTLNVPVFYVRGNHANKVEYSEEGQRSSPGGALDLHRRVLAHQGVLMAGFEGSLRYNQQGPQYSQREMWLLVFGSVPRLLFNRLRYGRYLDVLVSHAPPWGINDGPDYPHHGFKALRWLLRVFRPKYHFHGHVHLYAANLKVETQYEDTLVINTYGCCRTDLVLEMRNDV